MRKFAAVLAVLLLAAPAVALELSLEENRAEHGSVGFVDMQRLFASSPDAQRAKDSFEDVVREAEERVNRRRAELVKLHQELDATRAERAALAASANAPAAAPSPAETPAASTAPAAAPAAAVAVGSAPHARREAALPGMSPTDAEPSAPPGVSSAAAAVAVSSAPAAVAVSSAAAAVAVSSSAAPSQTLAQRLLDLDGRIIAMQANIQTKEAALTQEREDADKGLVDVENRKTDKVLADLYRAIAAVAQAQGVSIVIDKTTILYGHPAVDLTDRVLEYLKEHPEP
jgi:Skp family chaperone for outer membrane proteins